MYCVKAIHPDLYWVGANDRRLALFENVYPISRCVSYNSYVLLDEKTDAGWTISSSTTWSPTTAAPSSSWFCAIPR